MSKPRLLDLFCGAGGAAIIARFWKYVQKRGTGDCWEWIGSKRHGGYGQLNIRRYPYKAHRLSWAIHNGDTHLNVLHHCDNPSCVNPKHLFIGTQADNMQDAANKGRAATRPRLGASNSAAKLTDDLVREARQLHSIGQSLRALANRYKVDRKTITQAIRREHWKHVR